MTGSYEILVVEDSKTQADLLCYYLTQAGYHAIPVDCPASAFTLLSDSSVDLILTDIIMPGMDGYVFCHTLRNDPKYSSIPIVFVSQLSDPADIIKGLCCGANNFIIKPVRKEQLISEVNNIFSQKMNASQGHEDAGGVLPFHYENHTYSIRSSRYDLLRILLSIYQTAAQKNSELEQTTRELNDFSQHLEELVKERTQALSVTNEIVEHLLMQRTELITRIGHDLKTPLTPLYAFLPYLLRKETDPDKKEILSLLVKDVTVLKQLVERILKMSHISIDSFSEEKTNADIHLISLEVLGNHSYLIEQKGIQVKNYIRPLSFCKISHFHIMTIMENLVSNAINYNSDGGTITLSCEQEGYNQVLTIEDTGIGLTSEQTVRVFEDFYKADESRHDHNAHGLGLSIVRRIVTLYGGFVSVYSPGPGRGSTFQVVLPYPEKESYDMNIQNGENNG